MNWGCDMLKYTCTSGASNGKLNAVNQTFGTYVNTLDLKKNR